MAGPRVFHLLTAWALPLAGLSPLVVATEARFP